MFFITAYASDGSSAIVFDTNDGAMESIDAETLKGAIKGGMHVYGANVYNNKLELNCLNWGIGFSCRQLTEVIEEIRKVHNPWTVMKLENYLAMVEPGSKFLFLKYDMELGKQVRAMFKKVDEDAWSFNSNVGHVCDGRRDLPSFMAARVLDTFIPAKGRYVITDDM